MSRWLEMSARAATIWAIAMALVVSFDVAPVSVRVASHALLGSMALTFLPHILRGMLEKRR